MTAQSAFVAGQINAGVLAFMTGFGTEINSLANGNSVMSSVIFNNDVALDEFLDLSAVLPFTTAQTIVAGACVSFWAAYLQADGATYGDGRVSSGAGGSAYTPPWPALGAVDVQAGSTTVASGDLGSRLLRPNKFKLVMMNSTGFAFAATGLVASVSTYRLNLNA